MAVLYAPLKSSTNLFERHRDELEKAIEAIHRREFYTPFPELPLPQIYGETADSDQKKVFDEQLRQKFARLKQSHESWTQSNEQSPYTLEPLSVSYPTFSEPSKYVQSALKAWKDWRKTDAKTRAGILFESLERMKSHFYEIAYAAMHTTGQSFMMSFQAGGPHAADRALEAIALGYHELTRFPEKLMWEKPAGKVTLKIEKFCTTVPKGLSLCIGCAAFPVWNSVPGIYASLVTGNPVIVKPHPLTIYPIAIVVALIQEVLVENGFSADLVSLALDNENQPITKVLAEDPAVKIIDFTGTSAFGKYIETLPGKVAFTAKAGVNSIIIDSVSDLPAVAQNLAFSICLYSGQMCTTPQNFYVPKGGINAGGKTVSFEEVENAIITAIESLVSHPKVGPGILGAIQCDATFKRIAEAKRLGGKVLLESKPIQHPEFQNIRSASPIVIEIAANATEIFWKEIFGPIVFIIPTTSTDESLQLAAQSAREHGAISCGAYTTDQTKMQQIADTMAESGTPVAFNLVGNIYVNQNAGFSDFHVTGGNPSGNASLTDPEFVLKRFTRVQAKVNC